MKFLLFQSNWSVVLARGKGHENSVRRDFLKTKNTKQNSPDLNLYAWIGLHPNWCLRNGIFPKFLVNTLLVVPPGNQMVQSLEWSQQMFADNKIMKKGIFGGKKKPFTSVSMALLSISNGYHTLLGSSKDESESKIVGLRILGHASYWDLFNNNPRHWSNPNWCKYPWMDRKHLLIHLFTEDEKRKCKGENIYKS